VLGTHPDTGKHIEANVGRFGPYVKHDGAFKSVPKSESVYDITLARAVELLAAPKTGPSSGGRNLGPHPIDQKAVVLMDGRYGPYIKHGNVNATVPTDVEVATLTLDDAVDLLAAKAAKELAKTGSTAARPIKTEPQHRRPGGPPRGGVGKQRPNAGPGKRPNSSQGKRPGGNQGAVSRGGQPSNNNNRPVSAGDPPSRDRGGRSPQRAGGRPAARRRPV